MGWVHFINIKTGKGYTPETLNYILELEKAGRPLDLDSPVFNGVLWSD